MKMSKLEKAVIWLKYDYLPRVGAYRKDCKQGCDACMPLHDGDNYCDIDMLCKILALLKEQECTIKELQNAYDYLQKQFFKAQDKLLKEQEAVEGHRIVLKNCVKDVVNEVIEKLCHPSDDKPGICCCAIKCQEHTNKNDLTL